MRAVLVELGAIKDEANISRIDLYVDFESGFDMEDWGRQSWVTRAARIDHHAVEGQFTGWSIGLGGIISARLYNKVIELIRSGKDWLPPLWQAVGWSGQTPVWRLEFEFKREVLTQKGLGRLAETLNYLGGLWGYATTEWLRLTLPSDDDKTRSRWPVHPLWALLSSVDWESTGGPLARRFNPTRSPQDGKLLQGVSSAIFSYMAKHAFEAHEFCEATEDLMARVEAYLESKASLIGIGVEAYLAERVALKRREYNTVLNDPAFAERRRDDERAKQARAYRRASDGD